MTFPTWFLFALVTFTWARGPGTFPELLAAIVASVGFAGLVVLLDRRFPK
jgi:hypothetical protein